MYSIHIKLQKTVNHLKMKLQKTIIILFPMLFIASFFLRCCFYPQKEKKNICEKLFPHIFI